jgi:hypothetical protein
MIFESLARLAVGFIRSLLLALAVVTLVDYMIEHPKAERSVTSVVFPLLILITREGVRWDK